ncbi:MAG: DHH family phosphoesterase [Eubacterium sp.]
MGKSKRALNSRLTAYIELPMILGIFMIIACIISFCINIKAGIAVAICMFIYYITSIGIYFFEKRRITAELVDFGTGYSQVQKQMLNEMNLPYGLLDREGRILWMNYAMKKLVGNKKVKYKHITEAFSTIKKSDIDVSEECNTFNIVENERNYKIELEKFMVGGLVDDSDTKNIPEEQSYLIAMYMFDQTQMIQLIKENHDERLVAGLIYIDNYDEALESVEDVRRSLLVALVDRKVNKYISSVNGIVKKVEKDKYFIAIKSKYVSVLQSDKFSIIDDVKTINVGNEMSVTISIGLGISGDTYIRNCEYSRTAIDLALGRGGDQAVVKDGEKIYYYGGKTKSVEKMTRVKARVKAHALRELLETREKAIIMGHKIGDVDSFGSAIGLYRAIKTMNKKAQIVIDELTPTVHAMYSRFTVDAGYEEDMFIKSTEAPSLIDDNTIVIVVDVNRPTITECPELLKKSKAIVVLDHHRQSSEIIENALLSYIEPYASSACELVAEILQYFQDGIKLKSQEADALYAGIMIDTNNFSNRTGVRTFEAAAFLKRSGADVTRVRTILRADIKEYKARAEAIQNAYIYMDRFVVATCTADNVQSPTVVGAQAANELLNINGVSASFVATKYNGQVYISARSLEGINVQLIMEKLGGGGHIDVAGAQMSDCTADEAIEQVKLTIRTMSEEGDL